MGLVKIFFKFMTAENARESYTSTIKKANEFGDFQIISDIEYRISQLKRISEITIEIDKLTFGNTHGDYFISQIICGENNINAVIDWTSACKHPLCWEVIRSFTYAEPSCKDGKIDTDKFIRYVAEYLKYFKLSKYDLKIMPYLFYYQLGVCDYYNQYYQSDTLNKHIFLHQAVFATKLMRWFENNIDELSEKLCCL